MQNHHGRFVLAVCLSAAAAAAQAPTLDNSRFREVGAQDAERGRPQPADASGRTLGEYPRYTPDYGGQDPVDYSLRGQFNFYHLDFMNRRERYEAPIEFGARVLPNQRIKHEPGSFDMIGYDADLDVPVLVATDGYLKFGAYYQGRSYKFSSAMGTRGNAPGVNLGDETLHAAGIKLGFGVFLDDNWLLEVESAPGIWTDGDDGLHHEDWDFPSFATFTYRAMPNLFFRFGARYNQIYEEAPWLPYLGINWEIFEGLRLDILAPETIEVSIWPTTATGILVGAEVTGAEYHVRTSEATGSQRDDLQVQEMIGYVGVVHRASDALSFRARGGIVFTGDYNLTTGGATFDRVEGALDQALFFEVSFGFDF